MKKVYYNFLTTEFNDSPDEFLNHFIEPCLPKSSSWYSSLDFFSSSSKSVLDHFRSMKNEVFEKIKSGYNFSGDSITTVKACPGIKDLLSNSYLVRLPCDVLVMKKDKEVVFIFSEDDLITIEMHPQFQFHSKTDPLFKDKVNLKFCIPIVFSSQSECLFLPPDYHAENNFLTLCGKLWSDHPHDLNINTLINLNNCQDEFIIKKGTPLAYLYFQDKVKFIHTEKKLRPYRTKFVGSKKSTFISVSE